MLLVITLNHHSPIRDIHCSIPTMLNFMNFFISSFSQLLSSPSFTMMANKSILSALDHCDSPSFGSQDDIQSTEAENRHIDPESSLRASLLALLHLRGTSHSGVTTMPPVPVNSPSLTPSNSFPDICGDSFTFVSTAISGEHSGLGPSISSTPTFDLSLISDSSDYPDEEPEDFFPSDYTSILSHHIQTPENLPMGVGLGIKGARKHDGSRPFDGIGLVSIRRWIPSSPRVANVHRPESLSQDLYDEGDAEISDTFLQEAAMTFIQDPLHTHSLSTIPECQSWSELDLDERETVSVCEFEASHASLAPNNLVAPLGRMKKHFSAPTISSSLKHTSARRMCPGGVRTRSSTWPGHARIKRITEKET